MDILKVVDELAKALKLDRKVLKWVPYRAGNRTAPTWATAALAQGVAAALRRDGKEAEVRPVQSSGKFSPPSGRFMVWVKVAI